MTIPASITGLGLSFKGNQGTNLCPVELEDGFSGIGVGKENHQSSDSTWRIWTTTE